MRGIYSKLSPDKSLQLGQAHPCWALQIPYMATRPCLQIQIFLLIAKFISEFCKDECNSTCTYRDSKFSSGKRSSTQNSYNFEPITHASTVYKIKSNFPYHVHFLSYGCSPCYPQCQAGLAHPWQA